MKRIHGLKHICQELVGCRYEPTIGFSSLTDIDYDIELDLDDPEAPEMKEPEQPKKEQDKETG